MDLPGGSDHDGHRLREALGGHEEEDDHIHGTRGVHIHWEDRRQVRERHPREPLQDS